ncbi:hypothetical protein HALLA_01135 (plasmid) [Halostagnicola larsenii XH-48]|uniref:DUF234 domain-containing protein n=1 Tax=Halostagnicola larsenii XH-48 TaxID=797299 RepID=W0JXI5_9EURY|nr:hypothetical protein HALLA_01135 [Halostagnicola larsenii XH-48]
MPDALPNLYPEKTFLNIGRWWYKEYEVDAVGFTKDGTMVVGECKFTNAPLDYGALASLDDHAAEIRWTPETGETDTKYALFTRSGATRLVQKAVSERDDLQLFDSGDVTRHV